MYYVQCPLCGSFVAIPADAVGSDRSDLWNVIGCDECDATIDYHDDEVQFVEVPSPSC